MGDQKVTQPERQAGRQKVRVKVKVHSREKQMQTSQS